jgi:hypothetical protein
MQGSSWLRRLQAGNRSTTSAKAKRPARLVKGKTTTATANT